MSLRYCLKHFLIILISANSVACSASASYIENDKMALLALRDGFTLGGTPPDDSYLNSWNSSVHICDWKGVRCGRRHKRVTVIQLVEQKLNGVLSSSIGNLSFLRELYLYNNSLRGEIPKQIGNLQRLRHLNLQRNLFQGHIPVELSNCSNLIILSLAINELTGQIPHQLSSLSKITIFYVGGNNLTGEMPKLWSNFSSLSELHIGDNNFHGEIGDSLPRLSKLTLLSLQKNKFVGMIPPSLYNLSSLNTLELDRNNFTGALTQHFGVAFPRLDWLNLGYNSFTGTLPSTLSNMSGLSLIQMNDNKFSGSVPEDLGDLKSLRILTLGYNNLGGSETGKSNDLRFIDSLTNCTKLETLQIESNMFGGPIPTSLGNLSYSLEFLRMRKNRLTGPIYEGIGNLYGLSLIDFRSNMLTGTIPDSIGNLSNLSVLILNDNNLHGEIPSSIGKLTNLYLLGLSANLFEGVIPRTLRNCKGMLAIDFSSNHFDGYLSDDVFSQFQSIQYCQLSHNSFSGRFPLQLANLKTLSILDASYNSFIGEIPAQLGESLEMLSMTGNSFEGRIPSSYGSLRGLYWLDLSRNNLSGPIPSELASLVLQNLNLSFNQLEGKVPLFKNVTGVSVVGNKKLCGGNPELQLPSCFLSRTRKTISKKVIIAAAVSTVALLSLFIPLIIFFYRRRKHTKESADGSAERHRRITYVELFKATEGFAESNLIGRGSFGDVFKGYMDGDETIPIAVKVLKLSQRGAAESFIAECKVLRSIRHRNLLRIITSCSSLDHKGNDFKALVFEYMSNGNLDSRLHVKKDQEVRAPLTLLQRLDIAIDLGCALNYLHNFCEPSIVHCDLKPNNILLDDDMVAHVGDFGLAKLLYGFTENMSGGESLSAAIKGTIGYIAPEYGMGAMISPQGDIYSYGILLLELISGKSPTNEMFNSERTLRSFIERGVPDHVEEVVDECLLNELNEAAAMQTNPDQYKLQWHAILVSFVEVGISCSAESPRERMDVQSAVNCLMRIKGMIVS